MDAGASHTKILIVDDDEDDYFIISEYIKNIPGHDFVTEWSFHYKHALDHMCEGKYDLYFVDFRLGEKTGLELLKEAIENNCKEPVILLTGKGNATIDREAMEVGAVDYLIKSELSIEKLERCIRYALERAKSLKALKQNEKKFRNIFEKSKDAVFIADENFVLKDFNNATSLLLDYSKEELLQLSLYDLLADKHEHLGLAKELQSTGEVDDKEVELLTRNGEKISCILSATNEKDEKNKNYIQGIIHDITNLKKAERATLQAEKLGAAGRLLQTLAHEVRNPLNNINISVEELNSEDNNEQTKTYLEIIGRNSKRINDLISELLNSSRPAELTMQKLALQNLINQSLSIASDRITLKKIKVSLSFPSVPSYIMGDEAKLNIVFLNIIINAIEAISHDNGLLNISIESTSSLYQVAISDNGSGISEENVARLFEPYFTSKKNGMGLGLASTLTILQSHKGSIEVKTKLGTGTTFIVSFNKA
jgi:two-component system, sporulation sensor kinase E